MVECRDGAEEMSDVAQELFRPVSLLAPSPLEPGICRTGAIAGVRSDQFEGSRSR